MAESIGTSSLRPSETRIGDIALTVYQGGSGQPLLFLHGADFQADAPIWNVLCREYRVIAPVHPGFGTSDLPSWMNTVDDFAYVYLQLLEEMNLESTVLVGSSIGAWIAAEIATKNTSRLDAIVLVGPVGIKVGPIDRLDIPDIFTMPKEQLHRHLYFNPQRWKRDTSALSDEDLMQIARGRATLAMVTWEPYMHNPKLKRRLQLIDRPTLVVRGAADGLVSPEYAAAYTNLIPGACMVTIEEAGHYPYIEQPERFAETLLAFARKP